MRFRIQDVQCLIKTHEVTGYVFRSTQSPRTLDIWIHLHIHIPYQILNVATMALKIRLEIDSVEFVYKYKETVQ
jgi:hypothetical protein